MQSLGKLFQKRKLPDAALDPVGHFIHNQKELYESRFGEVAVSIILQPKLMLLMILFMVSISTKYWLTTQNPWFFGVLVPLIFTGFFHRFITRFLPSRQRYLMLYIHIFFYVLYNTFNQITLALYYPSVVASDQFVMIVILTTMLSSLIATSPYYSRVIILNGLLLGLFTAGMLYAARIRNLDILRHSIQGIGLGGALSFVMMTIYRYRVYFVVQENALSERAAKIQAIHADLATMQDTIPACIIKLDKSLRIIYANKAEEYLGLRNLKGAHIKEFITAIEEIDLISADHKDQFHQTIQAALGENFELCYLSNEDKLLREFTINGRPVAVQYGPHIDAAGNLDYLLITISDNSAKIQHEHQRADNDIILALVERLGKVAGFVGDAYFFVTRIESLLQTPASPDAKLELKRMLHTFKGVARTMGLAQLATHLHELESSIELAAHVPAEQAIKRFQQIKTLVERIKHLAQNKLQVALDDNLVVLSFTEGQIIDAYMQRNLDSIVLAQACYDLRSAITFFESALVKQAIALGKEAPRLVVNSPDIYVFKENAKAIDTILGHVLRNAIDHGIETAAERGLGLPAKPAQGTITVNVKVRNGSVHIAISDDGRGLALKKLRDRGVQQGLIAENTALSAVEIAHLIFVPSLSTQDKVSETSGRGVGMDAVRASVVELGGRVDLEVYGDAEAPFAPWALLIEIPDRIVVNLREHTRILNLAS